MNFLPITLEGFEGREEALAGIKRYIHELFSTMYYRTNDLTHSWRVLWHLEEAIPDIQSIYGNEFDVGFARTLALVHDDAEIITGDVQLYDKERMTDEELRALAKKEKNAVPLIVKKYSEIANGHKYEDLLATAKEKTRLEAQFVSFFDKFDGAGEAWHEVWAGNKIFLRPACGFGKDGGYVRRLREFPQKYPSMTKFFQSFPEYLPNPFDFNMVAEQGKPHTIESIEKDSDYAPYERWKRTIMKREGNDKLLGQLEFDASKSL